MDFATSKGEHSTPQGKQKFSVYDDSWSLKQQQMPQSQEKQHLNKIASLTQEINRKDQEIGELRLNNEVLVAAMYQADMLTATSVGEPDAVEISHRIMSRLVKLRKENEKLMLKSSGTYASQLEVEVSTLKRLLAQSKGETG